MTNFRRVPYGTDPEAQAYHAAHGYALMKTGSEGAAAKFAWWYIDTCADQMAVAEAWRARPTG
jgi:hypothetical protein